MESHHHHHQLQDQLVGSSAPSCYGLGITPPSFLNTNGFTSSYPNEAMLNSRHQENYTSLLSSQNIPPYNIGFNYTTQNFSNHDQDLQPCRMKEQLSDQFYRNYTELLSTNPNSSHHVVERNFQENETKSLLKSFSSGNLVNKIPSSNGRFSQIFPSINVSNLNDTALDMNLEAVDLLASSRFNGEFTPSSQNQTPNFRDGFSFGFDHMQHPSQQIPFYASNKVSAISSNNVAAVEQAKRNSNKMEPKALVQNAPKKSRLEARSSCPPFKVRKEKLGDRIAALQQLVAPFGKTDTASVLMEAIGYIKFLQSQVETLSVPYMKAPRNKPNRVMKGGHAENENEESKRDLKSRGLCLVPLTCLSYITTDGGGAAVWPPPQFGGAT